MADPAAHGLRTRRAGRDARGLDEARGRARSMMRRMAQARAAWPSRRRRCSANRRCGTRASRCCTGATSPAARCTASTRAAASHDHWDFDTEPACCAPLLDGGLLLAMRDGLWRFDPRQRPARALRRAALRPGARALQRRQGRPAGPLLGRHDLRAARRRRRPRCTAARDGAAERMADGITVSNGLAWSPDGRTMYWSDTQAHTRLRASTSTRRAARCRRPARVRAAFPPSSAGQALATYGGRPDGAAVDAEGCYWVAMFEGAAPAAPVARRRAAARAARCRCAARRCRASAAPTCSTLYVTTARENRPADELASSRWPAACCAARRRAGAAGQLRAMSRSARR